MDKLYRLVQAAGMSVETYDSRIGVRVNTPESLEQVRAYLPPGWKETSSPVVDRLYSFLWARGPGRPGLRRFHALYLGAQNLVRSEREQDLLEAFESDLSVHIAQVAPDQYFVHAGVVGWQGAAIVVPGPSHSGKTTLIKEFLLRGATYYSDEFAVFDRRGFVHPFPRQLGIRPVDGSYQNRTLASQFGVSTGTAPLPVALVLVTRHQAAACWRPTEISAARGALALLANALSARRRPAGAMTTMEKAVRHARVFQGRRGEAREAVDSVLRLLSERYQKRSETLMEVE